MGSNKLIIGVNDFKTCCPGLAAKWNYELNGNLTPRDVCFGSSQRIWLHCDTCERDYNLIVANARKSGCPYCGHKKVNPGVTDLATICPEIALEWDNIKNGELTASQVFPNDNRKRWWICPEGHSYDMSPNARFRRFQMGQKSCPYCSGARVLVGFNDLLSKAPSIAAKWHPTKNGLLKPTEVTYGSGKRVWWHCDVCGQDYEREVHNQYRGIGCPVCAGRKIIAGVNSLADLNPDLCKEWSYTKNQVSVDSISAQTHTKYWWKCSICGYEFEASPHHRVAGKTGCPACNASGGEQMIRVFLEQHGISFRTQEKFDDCKDKGYLRHDFTLYKDGKLVGAIEYHGAQHWVQVDKFPDKNLMRRDLIKTAWCNCHGIPQLIVWVFYKHPYLVLRNFLVNLNLLDKSYALTEEESSKMWEMYNVSVNKPRLIKVDRAPIAIDFENEKMEVLS